MYTWFKAKDTLPHDSQNTHRIAMSFASDANISWSIFIKYPEKGKELLTTSLDHSIWFYENVDFNQWHLSVFECVRSAHGRPLNISRGSLPLIILHPMSTKNIIIIVLFAVLLVWPVTIAWQISYKFIHSNATILYIHQGTGKLVLPHCNNHVQIGHLVCSNSCLSSCTMSTTINNYYCAVCSQSLALTSDCCMTVATSVPASL